MKTKTLLSIAIIAASPFGAMADYTYVDKNTPVQVAPNGTVTRASALGPYAIATIGDDDDEHIASTAYVKGAYNDAVAAVNAVKIRADEFFQQKISVYDEKYNKQRIVDPDLLTSVDDVDDMTQLVTGMAVKNAIDDVNTTISAQRVTIYTTWDDDSANATTQVALSTAQ